MSRRGPEVPDLAPPRPVLIGGGLLIAAVLVLAAVAGTTGTGRTADADAGATAVASRWLGFRDQPDGSVRVVDARSGEILHAIPAESNFFTRGVLRSLVRQRRKRFLEDRAAFRLTLWSDGQLVLEDTATDTRVDLTAFGPTNRDAFLRFLGAAGGSRPAPTARASSSSRN